MTPCQLGIHPPALTWLDRLTTALGTLTPTLCRTCNR